VVDCVVDVVFKQSVFGLKKCARFWGFIFDCSLFGNEAGVGLLFFSRFAVARPVVMGFAAQENSNERQREGKGWLQTEGQT
jgi:hypothetical protein